MEQVPTISIGMPVYNAEEYIEEALDSIIAQTYEDFELIICDNASEDRTMTICERYAENDQRITIYKNSENVGAAENYNRTFRLAKGKYFKWCSYDDICAPTFLERCIDVLELEKDVVLCYPKTVMVDEDGNKVGYYSDNLNLTSRYPYRRLKKFESNVDLCNSVFGLIRRQSLQKTSLIGKYIGSDVPLLIELCLQGKFHEIPENLFFRRDHDSNCRRLSLKERAKWFDTTYRGKSHRNPMLYLFLYKLLAIKNSQLSYYEKILCYPQIIWWVLRKWRNIGGRYKAAVKKRIGLKIP